MVPGSWKRLDRSSMPLRKIFLPINIPRKLQVFSQNRALSRPLSLSPSRIPFHRRSKFPNRVLPGTTISAEPVGRKLPLPIAVAGRLSRPLTQINLASWTNPKQNDCILRGKGPESRFTLLAQEKPSGWSLPDLFFSAIWGESRLSVSSAIWRGRKATRPHSWRPSGKTDHCAPLRQNSRRFCPPSVEKVLTARWRWSQFSTGTEQSESVPRAASGRLLRIRTATTVVPLWPEVARAASRFSIATPRFANTDDHGFGGNAGLPNFEQPSWMHPAI